MLLRRQGTRPAGELIETVYTRKRWHASRGHPTRARLTISGSASETGSFRLVLGVGSAKGGLT